MSVGSLSSECAPHVLRTSPSIYLAYNVVYRRTAQGGRMFARCHGAEITAKELRKSLCCGERVDGGLFQFTPIYHPIDHPVYWSRRGLGVSPPPMLRAPSRSGATRYMRGNRKHMGRCGETRPPRNVRGDVPPVGRNAWSLLALSRSYLDTVLPEASRCNDPAKSM